MWGCLSSLKIQSDDFNIQNAYKIDDLLLKTKDSIKKYIIPI